MNQTNLSLDQAWAEAQLFTKAAKAVDTLVSLRPSSAEVYDLCLALHVRAEEALRIAVITAKAKN